ncbi:LysR family transcriptional regulator [Pollutimonas bauzanensis]|uniref:DNA-binding transcriptional regulator, LysR family n=1 Tax=Pollutimonas bauzanensis TaxID=658167 RepID=A0A1M5UTE4_9BURK|nr:LysR family transcriptional regulator [Pollutimonas bauzanensis]SHH66259.1 DNA-binding transcriptional regulator, LysR family [Pollutimonas bauzanensis]
MRRKIPSTNTLTIFEAAARHGSFARAASELCLTESAVSRQITSLENYLDIKLFARVKKQVVLNDAGQAYIKNIAKSLADIEAHTLALMANKGDGGVLELAVIPTFANRWLLPRLQDFRRKHPNIMLNLSEKPQPFMFRDTIFDAALHFDHPAWTGVVKVDLFEERLVPVISPNYFDVAQLTSPQALLNMPLLHKSSRPNAWQHWFELAGYADGISAPGMHFDMYGMVIEAARAGLGAGLVPRFYVNNEIHRHDLMVPFDLELRHEKRYCLVYPEYKQDSPVVQAFRDWIVVIEKEFTGGKPAPALRLQYA